MIELDLRKVLEHLVWKLEVLAVIRRVCAANGVDFHPFGFTTSTSPLTLITFRKSRSTFAVPSS